MLSGVKFIPRDQVDKEKDEKSRKSLRSSKDKSRRRKKKQGYSSSDDDIERIKKTSNKKKKWYSSEEESDDFSESGSASSPDQGRRRGRGKKKNERTRDCSDGGTKTKSRGRRKHDSSEYGSSDEGGGVSTKDTEMVRKEMGLEWMLRPQEKNDKTPATTSENPTEEATEAKVNVNPRELNPYLRSSGSGYPDERDGKKDSDDKLLSSSVVGDGGASWRLKALKRAQEQAARDGRKLNEVVEERWGSLGQLTVSAASHRAAPPRAHLHAIRHRKKGPKEEQATENETERDIRDIEKSSGKDYLRGISSRHPEMKAPKVHEGLSWGSRKSQNVSSKDAGVISAAASTMNKFTNDGNFMQQFIHEKSDDPGTSIGSLSKDEENADPKLLIPEKNKHDKESASIAEGLSANQLAAKALQLRLKGKHDEAEKLMKEAENLRAKEGAGDDSIRPRSQGSTSRYVMQDASYQQKKRADDTDMHLAQRIVQNKLFSVSGQADEEYDFDEGPRKKSRKKGGHDGNKATQNIAKRLLTQQERCIFCFENQDRPKHLIVSIANFTYLMLPKWQPVVSGHCCILTLQHESATRNVDNNVWEEIRNFKKCLIRMFAKQEKEMVFLETVMGLAQQRRHCLIECIPMPQEIAKQAPLYFKKAIDEAEDEWSQHNAKRLIDTSEKGLRGSIPKNFPYFHVEFGLSRGFVHVIDDEKQFKSSLGLNVIRGMLQLPEEDMHRRRKYDSVEAQRQAVVDFAKEWEPFDWTKQLE